MHEDDIHTTENTGDRAQITEQRRTDDRPLRYRQPLDHARGKQTTETYKITDNRQVQGLDPRMHEDDIHNTEHR